MSDFTGKQVAVIIPLVVIGALAYGYWDYTRKQGSSRVAAPQTQPGPPPAPAAPPLPLDRIVTWKSQYDEATQEEARKVLDFADAACNLDALRPHIASIRIGVETETDYLWVNREYGWGTVVTLDLAIKDDQATWNTLGPDPRRVAGHTLHLMAGGGRRPALVADKQWIRERCNMDIGYGGENGILDIPSLSFLRAAEKRKKRHGRR